MSPETKAAILAVVVPLRSQAESLAEWVNTKTGRTYPEIGSFTAVLKGNGHGLGCVFATVTPTPNVVLVPVEL